ncbi:MAG: DsbA family oxidoreductase [Coriobacteriales bacterium]|jgi:predicted DsbA family dithiol-disulfide isomerase
MKISYWSDYACPYCYIGETRLRKAIESVGGDEPFEIEMRAFELDPGAPRKPIGSTLDRFARKYCLTTEQARERIESISQMGRDEGLEFNYMTTLNTNMLDAHRLTKLARDKGVEGLEELYYEAYFSKNEVLADRDVLRKYALQVGLAEEDIDRVLGSDEYKDEVRDDEYQARALGIRAVPFFVIDDSYAIAGCYPTEEMEKVLAQALRDKRERAEEASVAQGMVCGPDGCGIG